MHFVTGGSFNGKRKWVLEHYKLHRCDALLISPFTEQDALNKVQSPNDFRLFTIIEGLEQLIIATMEMDNPRVFWQQLFAQWQRWESQGENRRLILIGSDVSKGIVPIEREHRIGRDLVGFCYQDLVELCSRVDLIWYGINQPLKP